MKMKIIVRYRDGGEEVWFDSRPAGRDSISVIEYAAKIGLALTDIKELVDQVEAWIELDNGKKLLLT